MLPLVRRRPRRGSLGGEDARSWRALCAALRDPARSDFAFVPHQYVRAPAAPSDEVTETEEAASESTPVHARRSPAADEAPQRSAFFARCVAAAGVAGIAAAWAALFPMTPARMYNLQVDVFGGDHGHAVFFLEQCLPLGQVLGAALGAVLGDRLGRVGALELAAVPLLLGWVAVGAAAGALSAVAGRYLLGAAAGMLGVLAPVFLAEITAAGSRGRVLALQALLAELGALGYLALGALSLQLARLMRGGLGLGEWRALAAAGLLPALALLALAQRLPDTPTFLVARHGDRAAALRVSLRLFGGDRKSAERFANAVVHARELAAGRDRERELLRDWESDRDRDRDRAHGRRVAFYRPLLLCCALVALRAVALSLAQPALGSTSAGAFELTVLGVPVEGGAAGAASAGAGDAQLLLARSAARVAGLLGLGAGVALVDSAGRRLTLRAGCYVAALASVFILVASPSAAALSSAAAAAAAAADPAPRVSLRLSDATSAAALLLLLGLQLGLGVVPAVLASELFPARQRLGAVGVVGVAEALARLAAAQLVPRLRAALPPAGALTASAAAAGACSLAALLASWLYVPETSGRSLQEIEAILSGWRPATPRRGGSRVRLTYGSTD